MIKVSTDLNLHCNSSPAQIIAGFDVLYDVTQSLPRLDRKPLGFAGVKQPHSVLKPCYFFGIVMGWVESLYSHSIRKPSGTCYN
jgi:hypothetical protein